MSLIQLLFGPEELTSTFIFQLLVKRYGIWIHQHLVKIHANLLIMVNTQERKMLLQGFSKNIPMNVSKEDLDKLAEELDGWTGSDIDNLCREAALEALRIDIDSQRVKRYSKRIECSRLNSHWSFHFAGQVEYTHLERARQICRPVLMS